MDTYVIIATYENPKEAYYVKFRLGLEGIDAYLLEQTIDTESNIHEKGNPLRVQVDINKVEESIKILFDIKKELEGSSIEEKIKSIKRILVPIDFSDNSLTACLFAFALAKKLSAEIKLLHVYNDPFLDSGFSPNRISYQNFSRNVLHEIEDMVKKNLTGFLNKLQKELNKYHLNEVKYHYNLRKGKPEYQIIKLSEVYRPFIIVIGTQGAGKMPNDIIGRVATKVIENTSVPILAIPQNWKFKEFEKTNLLYATDFHDSDFSSFNKLIEITKPFNIHFHCIHIETSESAPWKEMQMFKLESYLSKTYSELPINCHLINHPNLLEGIQEFVDKSDIDIISFTSPKRSTLYKLLFPNNLKKMVYQSKTPLLVFHAESTNF